MIDEGAGQTRAGDVEPVAAEIEEGDVVKFVREIRMYDDQDWERVVKDQSASG